MIACSKDDGPTKNEDANPTPPDSEEPTNPGSSETVNLNLDELSEMNLEDIIVFSLSDSTEISETGTFKNISDQDSDEVTPVIFVENDELLFGYFPDTMESSELSVNDILLFYFATYPEIYIRNIPLNDLKNIVKDTPNNTRLNELIISSLNQNKSPFDYQEFVDLFQVNLGEILGELSKINQDKGMKLPPIDLGYFEFKFERDGLIEIPKYSPMGTNIAVSIKNSSTNEYVIDDYIVKPQNWSLNSSSLFNEIHVSLNGTETVMPNTFQLNSEGEYFIEFTNGNDGNLEIDKLEASAIKANKEIYSSLMLSYVVVPGLKKFLTTSSDDCRTSINELRFDLQQGFVASLNPGSNELDFLDLFATTSKGVLDIAWECGSEVFKSKAQALRYFQILFRYVIKPIATTLRFATFAEFIADSKSSIIEGNHLKRYFNGILYGNLKQLSDTLTTYNSDAGEEIIHVSKFAEHRIKYKMEKELPEAGIAPEPPYFPFKIEQDYIPAVRLPFKKQLVKGDALVLNNGFNETIDGEVFLSDENGQITFEIIAGEEDSEILITPDFKPYEIRNEQILISRNSNKDLFHDARIIKEFFEVNSIDVSDSRWNSTDIGVITELLEEKGCVIRDNRVVEFLYGEEYTSLIPTTMGDLNMLEVLYLWDGGIETVPIEISKLDKLKTIGLSDHSLKEIPPFIFDLNNLERMGFRGNQIEIIPTRIGNLSKLIGLDLSRNLIKVIPDEVYELTNLTGLSLGGNQVDFISEKIGNLVNLSLLQLDQNNISEIPSSVGNLTNLIRIDLSENNISSLPPEVGNWNIFYGYFGLNQLSELPAEIGNWGNAIDIFFSNNQLTSIPKELGNFRNCTKLSLYHNKLVCLPIEVWNLETKWGTDLSWAYGNSISNFGDVDCSN